METKELKDKWEMILCNIGLDYIITLLERTYDPCLSEIDTQIFLIEPVLHLLGWNMNKPNQVKRAKRSKISVFDIALYRNYSIDQVPLVAIECKPLKSNELWVPDGIKSGRLVPTDSTEWPYDQPRSGKNRNKDGLAQLRRYCVNEKQGFDASQTIPVFTNGKIWFVFNGNKFVENPLHPVRNNSDTFQTVSITDPGAMDELKDLIGREKVLEQAATTSSSQ